MNNANGVLIVGAGLAGSRCAEALRSGGFEGAVAVVGDEWHEPYDRTRLSKTYLSEADHDPSLREVGHLASLNIELLTNTSIRMIDAPTRTACDSAGIKHRWSHLVLATGAAAINPFTETVDAPNAFVLRSRSDADAIKATLRAGSKLVIVGAGFIGMELASTMTSLDVDVTVVDAADFPLERALGSAVGSLVAQRALDAGCQLHLGTTVEHFTLARDGCVERVVLGNGIQLDADAIVIAVGSRPRLKLAKQLRIERNGSVPTNAFGCSLLDGVYACGDIAAFPLAATGESSRVEHWTSAAGQALAVASHISGNPQPFLETPYFWSDLFDMRIQRFATGEQWSYSEVDGDATQCVIRYLDDDNKLVAGATINNPRILPTLRRQLGTDSTVAA